MARPRHSGSKDGNHDSIVGYLQSRGVVWLDTWKFDGIGCDGIGLYMGYLFMVEIKNPEMRKGDRKLTAAELRTQSLFSDRYHVIETIADCDAMLGEMRGVA